MTTVNPLSRAIKASTASIVILMVMVVLLPISRVHADDKCDIEKGVSDNVQENLGVNVFSTINHTFNGLTATGISAIMGGSLTETAGCEEYLIGKTGLNTRQNGETPCSGTPEARCNALTNTYTAMLPYDQAMERMARDKGAGSLLGLTYTLQNQNYYEPVPMNLAYFWNDSISKVPFANTSLAAPMTYSHPLIGSILNVWKLTRNVALGIMSIILLVIGFMIIMRKKVNQQVVVSIQYSLPKILLALVLILFSYPIGATISSLAWVLKHSFFDIVNNLSATGGFDLGISGASAGGMVMVILLGVLAFAPAATFLYTLLLVVIVVVVGMFAFIELKKFILLIKMLFSTISAPIEFALSAVPGSENKITDWFKRMAVYGVTIIAMEAIPWAAIYMGWEFLSGSFLTGSRMGVILGLVAPLFIVIYGFGLALGMEKRVEGFIVGAGAKKK